MSLRQPELYQIVDRVPACVRDMLLGQMILISCKWQANVYNCRILESLKIRVATETTANGVNQNLRKYSFYFRQ